MDKGCRALKLNQTITIDKAIRTTTKPTDVAMNMEASRCNKPTSKLLVRGNGVSFVFVAPLGSRVSIKGLPLC